MRGAHSRRGGSSRFPYLLILSAAIACVFLALAMAEARVAHMVGPAYTRHMDIPLDGSCLEGLWGLVREAVEGLLDRLSKVQSR